MKKEKATIANQINQEIPNPTLRWVFQCFEGINLLQQGDKISLSVAKTNRVITIKTPDDWIILSCLHIQ
jgi:hypothetical protein